MHFIVAWDIDAPDRRQSEIEKQLASCLSNYVWASPVNNFFIIQAKNSQDYQKVRQCLARISREFPNDEINFIMGPMMKGGRYDGLLPEDMWEAVNEITG